MAVVPLLPYASLVDPGYRGAEFGPLVERLRALGAGDRPLGVESQWVAGNLAFAAPDLRPRLVRPGERPAPGSLLVLEETHGTTLETSAGSLPTDREAVTIPRGRRDVHVVLVPTSARE